MILKYRREYFLNILICLPIWVGCDGKKAALPSERAQQTEPAAPADESPVNGEDKDCAKNCEDAVASPALRPISDALIYAQGLEISPIIFTNKGGATQSCSVQPTLPAGLSVKVVNGSCQIVGAATQSQNTTLYTITAKNKGGENKTATVTLTVRVGIPPVISDLPVPVSFVVTQPVSGLTFANTGDPAVTCLVSPSLPDGLSVEVHDKGCRVTGTSTVVATETEYTVAAISVDGSRAEATFTMTVNAGNPPVLGDVGAAQHYVTTVTIVPFIFNNTGDAATTCQVTPSLPHGLSLDVHNDSCRISGTPTGISAQKSYTITAIAADQSRDTATIVLSVIGATPPVLEDIDDTLQLMRDEAMSAPKIFANSGAAVVADGCSAAPALPLGLILAVKNDVSPHTCQISGTPRVMQVETEHTITAVAADGSVSLATVTIIVDSDDLECPDGFIPVSEVRVETHGIVVPAFCVMKYQAKDVGGEAVSQANQEPWHSISRDDAITACQSMNVAGYDFDLISNAQWQSLARQIELAIDYSREAPHNFLNWQNNSTGSDNALNRGNASEGERLAASPDDSLGCFGISTVDDDCEGGWHLNKRTHTLPNGQVIWDLAGNVWEWVKDNSTVAYGDNVSTLWLDENHNGGLVGPLGSSKTAFGSFGNYAPKGAPYGGLGMSFLNYNTGAILRGGDYSANDAAGIFSSSLDIDAASTDIYVGFRCVAVPEVVP